MIRWALVDKADLTTKRVVVVVVVVVVFRCFEPQTVSMEDATNGAPGIATNGARTLRTELHVNSN